MKRVAALATSLSVLLAPQAHAYHVDPGYARERTALAVVHPDGRVSISPEGEEPRPALSLAKLYLGYWVPGSRKMAYKAGFDALEIYKGGVWQPIGDPAQHSSDIHPLSVDPIVEQVASITLPPKPR